MKKKKDTDNSLRKEELQKQLKSKSSALERMKRELKIEAALERVRVVAMGISKPEDMLDVCKIIAQQLELLHVKEIRNVQTAIFYETKGTYINYEYYAKHDKLLTTEVNYNLNKEHAAFANQMLKGAGEFYTQSFKGKKLKDWYAYQKTTNVFIDKYLDTAPSLNYYFHSLGPVVLGVSTYVALKKEELNLFEKFLKVFELAYRRYLDIEKAEAQAREAQIELGLERVRARAMAMQRSDELSELVDTVFKELTKLDFALTWCIINIIDEPSMSNMVWAASPDIDKAPDSYHMKFEDYPFHHAMMKGWKERRTKYVYVLEGTEKKVYDEYLFNETEFRRVPKAAQEASRAIEKYVVSFSFSNFGGLQTVGDVPLSDANLDILSRFGKVFDLTYTRFNDLQKAEAQAREANIEAALEKVRSRSLAMHHSEELKDVISLVFEKLRELNVAMDSACILTFTEGTRDHTAWAANPDLFSVNSTYIPFFDHPMIKDIFEARDKGQEFFSKTWSFEEKNSFWEYSFEHTDFKYLPGDLKKAILEFEGWGFTGAIAKNSATLLVSYSEKIFSEKENDIIKRFGKVFEQAYIRFLDLQKAEAQARESQIQLALERVRARTMAMQHSDELKDAAALLFQQAKALGVPAYSCGYNIWEKDDKTFTSWMSTQDGSDFNAVRNIPLTEDVNFIRFAESRQKGEPFYVLELRGERMQEHYEYLKTIPAFKAYFDYAVSMGFDLPGTQIHHLANFSHGNLLFIALESCPEFHDVFKRFAAVFEQTYTRFLDLQKAEEQAREAQIEAALEKVRSRSLAMHKSDELEQVVNVVNEKLRELGVSMEDRSASMIIFEEGSKDLVQWVASHEHESSSYFGTPYFDHPIFNDLLEAKEKG
ncbi:MAG: hypothetical protein ACHQF0_15065, partial [Chitinophagales bacterium]